MDSSPAFIRSASASKLLREDDVIEPTTIARYKYWFDEETSGAKAGELASASDTMNIDISDVEAGEHTLWWCVGDSKGAWSEARSTTFNSGEPLQASPFQSRVSAHSRPMST